MRTQVSERMTDSDSDLDSITSVKSKELCYTTVPQDKKYKIKVFDSTGLKRVAKFAYVVEKGKELPYKTSVRFNNFGKLTITYM